MRIVFRAVAAVALVAGLCQFAVAETITIANTGKGSAQNWPLLIANDMGFFAKHGVTAEFVAAPSAASVTAQVIAGAAQIGTGGLTDPIRAIDQGAPLSLLRVEALVPPFTLWGKRSLHTIKELKQKLVMVGGARDITRIYLERMMVPNGLEAKDYDLVYAGTTVARFAALSSGAVDAALLLPPFSFKAEDAGFSNLGELTNYVKDLPFTGYSVRTDWALAHQSTLMGFLDGAAEGIKWFYDPANREAAIRILVKESGANRSDVERTYVYYNRIKIFDPKGAVTPEEISGLTKAMKALKDLDGAVDLKRFVDPKIAAIVSQAR